MTIDAEMIAAIILAHLIWASYLCIAIFLFVKTKFKFDLPAKFTILAYLACFTIRVANFTVYEIIYSTATLNAFKFIDYTSTFVLLMVLYYLVFECYQVQILLESPDAKEYFYRTQNNKKIKIAVLIATIILYVVSFTMLVYQSAYQEDRPIPNPSPEQKVHITSIIYDITLVIKLLIDFFMSYLFTKTFTYFVKRKYQILEVQGKQFTRFNVFLIIWTYSIIILYMIQKIGVSLVSIIIPDDQQESYQTLSIVIRFYIRPIFDMAVACTLSYLFYYQYSSLNKQKRKRIDKLKIEVQRSPAKDSIICNNNVVMESKKVLYNNKTPESSERKNYNTMSIIEILHKEPSQKTQKTAGLDNYSASNNTINSRTKSINILDDSMDTSLIDTNSLRYNNQRIIGGAVKDSHRFNQVNLINTKNNQEDFRYRDQDQIREEVNHESQSSMSSENTQLKSYLISEFLEYKYVNKNLDKDKQKYLKDHIFK